MDETFNRLVITNNPVHQYAFKWTVKNFSKLPGTVNSPQFTPVRGKEEEWQCSISLHDDAFGFDVQFCYANLYNRPVRVCYTIFITNVEGDNWQRSKVNSTRVFTTSKSTIRFLTVHDDYCHLPYEVEKLFTLPNDQLIVECFMTFYGYGLDTRTPSDKSPRSDVQKLQYSLGNLLETGKLSDVTLTTDLKSYPLHRAVLVSRSPRFAKLLLGEDTIRLDVKDDVLFEVVLKYLYTGQIDIPSDIDAKSLYVSAKEYELGALMETCALELMSPWYLTPKTACEMVTFADSVDDAILKKLCIAYIQDNFSAVESSESWFKFEKDYPELDLSSIKICEV